MHQYWSREAMHLTVRTQQLNNEIDPGTQDDEPDDDVDDEYVDCTNCQGTGISYYGSYDQELGTCEDCDGTGKVSRW